MIGGIELSHPYDCSVYSLDAGDLVVVDSGVGKSFDGFVANTRSLDFMN